MYDIAVTVSKVMGVCTADFPMRPGDGFTVSNGNVRMPGGGWICMWALHSLLPLLPLKERDIAERKDEDWVWRVAHAQCPDPDGRVIFRIDRLGAGTTPLPEAAREVIGEVPSEGGATGLKALRVVVDEVKGKCTSGMRPGNHFAVCGGGLSIPRDRHFCLYALQAVLLLLPAKQRPLPEADWLGKASRVICPDPAGNVVMRIEEITCNQRIGDCA